MEISEERKQQIHNKRKKYLMNHVSMDWIFSDEYWNEYSTFIISTGGDVTEYRVYGDEEGSFFYGIK